MRLLFVPSTFKMLIVFELRSRLPKIIEFVILTEVTFSVYFIEFLLHFSFANLLSKTAHRSSLEHASILIIYGGKNWGAREVWQPELEEQKEQPRFKPDI